MIRKMPLFSWVARIISLCSLCVIALFMLGEGFIPAKLTLGEWSQFIFFPIGVSAGMLVSWKYEGLGSLVTLISLMLFYLMHYVVSGRFPAGPWFLIFASPGFIFLISWIGKRKISSNKYDLY